MPPNVPPRSGHAVYTRLVLAAQESTRLAPHPLRRRVGAVLCGVAHRVHPPHRRFLGAAARRPAWRRRRREGRRWRDRGGEVRRGRRRGPAADGYARRRRELESLERGHGGWRAGRREAGRRERRAAQEEARAADLVDAGEPHDGRVQPLERGARRVRGEVVVGGLDAVLERDVGGRVGVLCRERSHALHLLDERVDRRHERVHLRALGAHVDVALRREQRRREDLAQRRALGGRLGGEPQHEVAHLGAAHALRQLTRLQLGEHLEALHLRGDGVAHLEHDHADRVDVHLVVVRQRRALLRRHVERGADAARHLPRRAAHATIGTSPPLLRPLLMRVGRDRRDVAHAVER
mmetsp:Transcript_33548/g.91891  ORF Transcript_33548/g.91891 Transcript_33548/m.91891 type:complete len:350 (-) Transcript_33548:718-1767(-)